ncbi:MAG: T9SS type A sorting domain-containing protein, partial [Bacteroidales bacterium]|nr:T9SS type A sorting domain-containing protein [Bacteroidales bacterium]
DAHDCSTAWGITIEITEPTQVMLWDIDIVHITGCYGELTGELHIDANGGTGILSYSIDEGNTWSQNNGDFTVLAAGYYFIQIMDENGCAYTLGNPVPINQPAMLVVSDVAIADVTECYGNTDGALDISASGGTGTILYSIDGGATFVDNGGLFDNLAGGDYHVFITDDNGCSGEYAGNPVTIGQPVQITMDVTSANVSGCAGNNDGLISISATGGTAVYTYSIDGGASWSSNPDFTDLIAGSYIVMTQDDLACTQPYAGNPVVIDEPTAIVYDDVTTLDLSCYGSGDGEIMISATGGTGTLYYSIDGGATYQTDANFFDLDAGDYNLMIMDDNGCDIAYGNNPVVLSQGNEIVISDVVATDVSCDGSLGSIVITANGGAGSLGYSIDNGAHYQVSNLFNNLAADTYIVKVKDANGCTQLYSGNPIVVAKLTPSVVLISADPDTEVCSGTDVTLTANAFEAVSYSWSTGETAASIIVNESNAGTFEYSCLVMNEDGCESEESIHIVYHNCIGIDEFDSRSISIYPNPNDGIFTLSITNVSQEVEVRVIDFAGRLILEEKMLDITANKLEKQYNFNDYERGVYFLRITHGDSVSYKKVVVQ